MDSRIAAFMDNYIIVEDSNLLQDTAQRLKGIVNAAATVSDDCATLCSIMHHLFWYRHSWTLTLGTPRWLIAESRMLCGALWKGGLGSNPAAYCVVEVASQNEPASSQLPHV